MSLSKRLLVFESHPVQYRVPIWQAIEKKFPGSIHVVYGSDCSVRGHLDMQFGRTISWDDPMLEGYPNTILNCERGEPLSSWGSLTGQGISELIKTIKPTAILLTGLNYRYDWVAYIEARRRNVPLWLRCETQDEAFHRSKPKAIARSIIYRLVYLGFSRLFYIGELNHQHYLNHGVPASKLRAAYYGTVNRFAHLNYAQKESLRATARGQATIPASNVVVGFSGKMIPKKNPDILFGMLTHLPESLRARISLYFIGSGELEELLKKEAHKAQQQFGVQTYFAGFVNQSGLAPHYLAMDILVLPSQQLGETWGLVVNEAMQAGCGVIVSDAVGCGADFDQWSRFKRFKTGEADQLAFFVNQLSEFRRDFDWANEPLKPYSIEATALHLTENLGTDIELT